MDPFGLNACKSIERKMKKIITKSIKPLKKLVAKQVVKLGAAAVPFAGWAMAAWTAYDIVTIGLDLKKALEQYDVLDAALEICLKNKKAQNNTTTKNTKGNKVKGKKRRKCGERKKHKEQGPDSDDTNKRKDRPESERMDSDHIPSKGYVHDAIKKDYKDMGPQVVNCMKKFASANMETVVIPNDVHKEKSKQTAPHLAKDQRSKRAGDLHQTAKDESKVVKKELDKKRGKNDSCAKDIKKALERFENLPDDYFDDLFDKALEHCE